ncbi:hypothetical protein NPIL_45241 [Nephila pilipes]|uniref:Uncharacterized protein n=1 Tax=Nephila pilipes TaxID=299642 RepID=A0A8X6TU40_NEPPI|nr:hypothetical protein NPIL_45241 [Nephila pilipes]
MHGSFKPDRARVFKRVGSQNDVVHTFLMKSSIGGRKKDGPQSHHSLNKMSNDVDKENTFQNAKRNIHIYKRCCSFKCTKTKIKSLLEASEPFSGY